MIPLRQFGKTHHLPQLAVHRKRAMGLRFDLPARPIQVRDVFVMDDDDHERVLDMACLYTFVPIKPVPEHICYRFPYARSSRGQIRSRYAYVRTNAH